MNGRKRTNGFWIAGFLLLAGCISCSSMNRTLTNRQYNKNGYRIISPYGTFVYEENPLKRTLKDVGKGYKDKTYIETDGDQKVDKIEYKQETFTRDEEGTEKMFEKADRVWREKVQFLQVKEVHQQWTRMSPSERVEIKGYFQN